jgi:hypothetical protein
MVGGDVNKAMQHVTSYVASGGVTAFGRSIAMATKALNRDANPVPQRQTHAPRQEVAQGNCFHCGKPGHRKVNCPQFKHMKK